MIEQTYYGMKRVVISETARRFQSKITKRGDIGPDREHNLQKKGFVESCDLTLGL